MFFEKILLKKSSLVRNAQKEVKMTRQELYNEIGMLNGNVSRMGVTEDVKELESMKEWAIKRIKTIYEENLSRINKN